MRRFTKGMRLLFVGLGTTFIVLVLASLVLARTSPGRALVLQQVLDRAGTSIAGDLSVGEITAARGLFNGFTLHDVRLDAPGGDEVVTADSARVGYELLSLVTTRTLSVRLYHPDVTLARLDDGRWNLVAALEGTSDPSDAGSASANADSTAVESLAADSPGDSAGVELAELGGQATELQDVRIVNGTVRIEQSDGEWLVFDAIEAVVPDLALGLGEGSDRADVSFASLRGHFEDGLLDVRTFRGSLHHEASILDVEVDRLELAESQARGNAKVDWVTSDVVVGFGLDIRRVDLADLHWLDARLPTGSGSGALDAEMRIGKESRWRFSGVELESGPSRLTGSGGLVVGRRGVSLESVDARAQNVRADLIAGWVHEDPDSLPGWVQSQFSGPVRASGPMSDLSLAAELDMVLPGADSASAVDLRGGLHFGNPAGARDFRVVARGVEFARIGDLVAVPGRNNSLPLTGPVNLDLRVDGRIDEGLDVTGDILRLDEGGSSVVRIDGAVARDETGAWPISGLLLLEPLRLSHVAELAPNAGLRGSTSGSVQVGGSLSNVSLVTDLQTSGGPLALTASVDLFNPTSGVRVAGPLTGFDLSAMSDRVPGATVLRGTVDADLTLSPEPVGQLAATLIDSSVGSLTLHRAVFGGVAREGRFDFDSLDIRTSAGDVRGAGSLALLDSVPAGRLDLQVAATSLEGLRPILFGDSILVADDLSDFELEILAASGEFDPDTLPSAEDVRVGGRAEGAFTIEGHLADWTATGDMVLAEAVYGRYEADSATVQLANFAWPSKSYDLAVRSGETRVWDRAYRSGELDVDFAGGQGRVQAALVRSPQEDIRVRAGFALDDSTTTINLDQATVRAEGERWNLGGPASASWGAHGITVSDFRLVRPEDGGLRLTIDGSLPRAGQGDLRVSALQVDLSRVAQLLQYDDQGIEGRMDLRLRLRGSPDQPLANGTIEATDVRFRSVSLSSVGGEIRYAGQGMSGELQAAIGEQLALDVGGTLPASLRLTPWPVATLEDAPIDLDIQADSVPLDAVLGFFEGFGNVEGTVTGAVDVRGRPDDLEPRGQLRVEDGAATIEFFGVRPEEFNGTFALAPDGEVGVDASFREAGSESGAGRVVGTVLLNPVSDPGFDLNITANRVRAVARRDVEGVVTGNATLTGRFNAPVIEGALTADEGTLFIDEFVRSAEVLDLSDPTLDLDQFFDTGPVAVAPDEINPFVQNLRANVALTMARNTWIRSQRLNQAMNLELAGTLDMTFDRSQRSLAMLGELQAVRGTYTTLGRNFTVEEGTVRFVGTPGVNPDLNFTADLRVPRQEGPLDITANVGGTLLAPSLRLSSEDQALSESDLYSYVVFGQPTYALSNSQQELVAGARNASVNLALGTLTSQLGSFLLSEDIPIDYLDISTSQYFDGGDVARLGFRSEVESTVATIGKYVSDDLFLGVRWRPFGAQGATSRNAFSGRLEWRFRDEWALEAFAEDRSLRESFVSLDALGLDLSKVFGLFIFREWGY